MAPTKRGFLLLFGSLLLSACGIFGDDEPSASPDEVVDSVVETIRLEFEDRWVEIEASNVVFGPDGQPTEATLDLLARNVANLSISPVDPVAAGIEFDGSDFVVIASTPGEQPDIATLAARFRDSTATSVTQVPFETVPAAIDDEAAQTYADMLNERLGDGIDVSVAGQDGVLETSILGPATTVGHDGDDWTIDVDFAQIEPTLTGLFADVGGQGGEASFVVERGENDDDPSTVVIVPGLSATACCSEASAERIAEALAQGTFPARLVLGTIDGERGTAWAEELGITELVGSFSTRYTPGQTRNINIQRIAELTQGVIIEPGESFSLNAFVGERTTDNGFVPAGTIVNGHLVDSVGGGISQYVTTLFNASFFAGLEFERYQSHSIYFSRYPYGREATISWPAPAFEISNPTPYGLLIWPTTTDNAVTVEIYSTKWVDVEQTGQSERPVGVACTRVTTERTRTFLDGETDVDTVFATYREEGIGCDGVETENPNDTTTTTDPDAPSTTVDPDAPSTTIDPSAPTTTTDPVAPTTSEEPAESSTTTVTTEAPAESSSTTEAPVESSTTSETPPAEDPPPAGDPEQ